MDNSFDGKVKLDEMRPGSIIVVRGSWGSDMPVVAKVDAVETDIKNGKPGIDYTEILSNSRRWGYLFQVQSVVVY